MNKHFFLLAGLATSFQFLVPTAIAAEASSHKLSEWKIGKVLFGPKFSKADLKGKVVVIENWGVHCPPCIASLPHLAKMDKDNRDKGLFIIGAESQGSDKNDIKPLIEKAGVEYTITAGAEGPIEFNAIPRVFVFDTTGTLVYDGYPSGAPFEKSITDALEAAAAPVAAVAPVAAGPLIASRSWKNSAGVEITAAVKSADATNVTFIMPNGQEVVYAMEKLSEESRSAIEEAAKPKE
jgi:thiol-disulfide isomerase/thioredoxin